MRAVTFLVALLLSSAVAGCGGKQAPSENNASPVPRSPHSSVTEDDVRRRFQEVRTTIGIRPSNGEKVLVRREPSRTCLARINDTLRPAERDKFIVAGELTALDREGDCWVAELDQGPSGGQIAYFGDEGQLLLTWLPPEG